MPKKRPLLLLLRLFWLGTAVGACCVPSFAAHAFEVSGKVSAQSNDVVPGAMVTLSPGIPGPTAITVFTDAGGNYRFPSLKGAPSEALKLTVSKMGFASTRKVAPAGRKVVVDVVLQPSQNVASDATPADWLDKIGLPDTPFKNRALLQCGDCHGLPSVEVKRAAAPLMGLEEAQRRVVWAGVVDRMRDVFGGYLDEDKDVFLADDDKEAISAFLAAKLPGDYKEFSFKQWQECCEHPRLGTQGTVIREYPLAFDKDNWLREVIVPVGSKYVWGTDLPKERLLRLDPATGQHKWIAMPPGVGGLHTLLLDNDGNFWGSALQSGSLVKFDPRTERPTVFPKFKSPDSTPIMVSDPAQNSRRHIAFDYRGRVWVNAPSHNMLASLDPATGEQHLYPLPVPPGRTARNAVLYGSVMTSDGKHLWWSQILGNVGIFNTETLENETVIEFPLGDGPRRMAIDDRDHVWVPLYGAGQIVEYDGNQRKELARYDLPTENAGVYAVTWDKTRNALWCAAMQTNSIFRLDIDERRWTEYKMPRDGARFRMVALDDQGNVWGSYGTFPGDLARPTMIMQMSPGPETAASGGK